MGQVCVPNMLNDPPGGTSCKKVPYHHKEMDLTGSSYSVIKYSFSANLLICNCVAVI